MIEYELREEMLIAHASGDVDLTSIVDSYARLVRNPMYKRTMHQLWDFCGVGDVTLSAADMRKLIELDAEIAKGQFRRRVGIAASNDLAYGMARMYYVLSETLDSQYMVFRDYYRALAWVSGHRSP